MSLSLNFESTSVLPLDSKGRPLLVFILSDILNSVLPLRDAVIKDRNHFSTQILLKKHWKNNKKLGDLALFISIPVPAMHSHTEPSCGTSHCSFVFLWLVELRSVRDRPSIPSAPAAHTTLTSTLTTCKVAGLFFYPVQIKSPQTIHRPLICPVSVPDMDHRSSSSFYRVIVPAA